MSALRVLIAPGASQIKDDNGIGRVVQAQFRYLPELGIELVTDPKKADVIACHVEQGDLPRIDVLMVHGLYWTGDPGSGEYARWHHNANARIAAAARRARLVTVPSTWVAEPFKRDMRLTPEIIGHGLDLDQWAPAPHRGYVLWNKNRPSDVCDPTPAWALAQRGVKVVSTFAPHGQPAPTNMQVTGAVSHEQMRQMVQHAEIYLATTKETFGIGTIEAMAAGVPVLGYDWGGTSDLVEHRVTGYLVRPGDIEGLLAGLAWLRANRAVVSEAARAAALGYAWPAVMARYAELYRRVAEDRAQETHGVAVVITNHNYGQWVTQAVDSVLGQTLVPEEIVVVDDGSTDDSLARLAVYQDNPRVRVIAQPNQGVAAARNNGITATTQPYIVCLDADDTLDFRHLQICQKALAADRGLGVAYTGLTLFNDTGWHAPAAWPPPDFTWETQATPHNPPSNLIPSASMFRRAMWERAGGYQQVWAPGEDTEFWTRGLSVGFTAKQVTPEHLFWYRWHEDSASRTKPYRRIDDWHPWMRDQQFPFAAPAAEPPLVRSYSEPLVSVVIPVGPGHTRHLSAALDSLLGQTLRDWEVIVVNDTGETWPEALRRTYPFARLVETAGRTGAGAARNAGLALARAPLVLWLDADDYLLPEALSKMARAFVQHEGRYIYTDWLAVNGARVAVDQAPEYEQSAWLYAGQHAVTVLMATDWARAVGGFDEALSGWEDWDFFVKLAVQGYCGARLAEPLLGYRQHTGQRRETSLTHKDELLARLRARYGDYGDGGGTPMTSCCGGNGEAILKAKQMIGALPPDPGEAQAARRAQAPATAAGATSVRMEYVGQNQGSIRFTVNGRHYRGGNNDIDRYHDMPPEDANALANDPRWRRVRLPEPPAVTTPVEAVLPTVPIPAEAAEELARLEAMTQATALPGQEEQEARVEAVKVWPHPGPDDTPEVQEVAPKPKSRKKAHP
jgi:glycosyltransferase involved in cell wall biosynthesis